MGYVLGGNHSSHVEPERAVSVSLPIDNSVEVQVRGKVRAGEVLVTIWFIMGGGA